MTDAQVLGSLYKYRVINDLVSVIDVWDTVAEKRTFYYLTAVGHPQPKRDIAAYHRSFTLIPEQYRTYDTIAQYHGLFIQFVSPDCIAPPYGYVQGPEVLAKHRWIFGGQNKLSIRIPDYVVKFIFRLMRDHGKDGYVDEESVRAWFEREQMPTRPTNE
jgi:hypothetical protein